MRLTGIYFTKVEIEERKLMVVYKSTKLCLRIPEASAQLSSALLFLQQMTKIVKPRMTQIHFF